MKQKKPALKIMVSVDGLFVAVCAGLGLATLLGFFGKLHWTLDLFSHFRVQYFQLFLLLTGFFLWRRHYRRMAVCLLLALVNYAFVLPFYFGKSGPVAKTEKPIRAMQLNIHSGNHDTAKVLAVLNEYNPDLILLEEVTPKWESDLQGLNSKYPYRISRPQSDCFGIMLLSRFPFRSSEILCVGNDYLPTIRAEIETPQGAIAFIGTHPLPPIGALYSATRNQQLEALPELVKKQVYPVLLAGDLNVSPWSPYFTALLHESGLKNSMQGFGFQPSWPFNISFMRIPIDHLLHSPEIIVRYRAVGADVGSDHLPVIIDFTLKQKKKP